jgi:phosphoribosylformylglycinamidine cyclo-ligase
MSLNYKDSGVDIERGNNFVDVIKNVCKHDKIGGFSGIYEHNGIKLVASTDGVGSKLELCKNLNKYDTIGIDLVAMCVNDIICQGAQPLFFLDYYAVNKLDLDRGRDIISGINEGCKQSGCMLLGGETAEMPLLYKENTFDLAGFSVGLIENDIYPKNIVEEDLIYGIRSSGVHSNGFTLINKLLEKYDYDLNELIKPTKIYVNDLNKLKEKYPDYIKGFSHITGGGLIDNIPRILNGDLNFNITISNIPDVFKWIYDKSDMSIEDMFKTYNCGIGMVVIFDKNVNCDELLKEDLIYLGKVIKSEKHIINIDENVFK